MKPSLTLFALLLCPMSAHAHHAHKTALRPARASRATRTARTVSGTEAAAAISAHIATTFLAPSAAAKPSYAMSLDLDALRELGHEILSDAHEVAFWSNQSTSWYRTPKGT